MEREVRYCTTEDGVRIAYCSQGEGIPLLFCPGFVESFSLDHTVPEEADFMRRVGAGRRLIRFDLRGTGLSQREVEDVSPAGLVRDLDAVVQALRLKQCYIWASTLSGPCAIAYAARYPRKVTGLVLYGTFARAQDVVSQDAVQSMAEFIRTSPDLAMHMLIGSNLEPASGETSLHALHLARVYRESASGDVIARMLLSWHGATDVTPLLPAVRAPAVVIHRRGDTLVPFAVGQHLASSLPNASLLPLEGTVHPYTMGDTEPILEALDAFVGGGTPSDRATVPPEATVRTVLFTDLVGHTEMMQRLGDEQGREVLREHERITREVLKAHGGTEVKTMGDGFMASFGSVTRAVECAVALQRAFEDYSEGRGGSRAAPTEPLNIRVGLNAGEPIEEEGDLFGTMVILAARIAAAAGGGEILASLAVRELCAGKGFLFADRGEFVAKGFEEPVRVYEARWRD